MITAYLYNPETGERWEYRVKTYRAAVLRPVFIQLLREGQPIRIYVEGAEE